MLLVLSDGAGGRCLRPPAPSDKPFRQPCCWYFPSTPAPSANRNKSSGGLPPRSASMLRLRLLRVPLVACTRQSPTSTQAHTNSHGCALRISLRRRDASTP